MTLARRQGKVKAQQKVGGPGGSTDEEDYEYEGEIQQPKLSGAPRGMQRRFGQQSGIEMPRMFPRGLRSPFGQYGGIGQQPFDVPDTMDQLLSPFALAKMIDDEFDLAKMAQRGAGLPAPLMLEVDVIEDDNAYHISADIPGFKASDISLMHDDKDNTISISGERERKLEETKDKVRRSERHYGSFERKFNLPKDADSSNIESVTEAGVLKITVPKLEELKQHIKEIPVKEA